MNEALKQPKRIVNRDFKEKVLELLAFGRDSKYIKKYVEDNKEVWSDIDLKKIEVYYFTKETNDHYYATRFLSELVSYMSGIMKKEDALKKKEAITDTGIQKILLAHLYAKEDKPELAFSADGIDDMNRNIVALNNGKFHHPIYKVRRLEKGNKYAIGQTGNKSVKYVEADKGTNLFVAIFSSHKMNKESGEIDNVRSYLTIPLNVMIDCQKKYGSKWNNNIENYLKEQELVSADLQLLFILSPNDLVYLPTNEQAINIERIYKLIDCSGTTANFIPHRSANNIFSVSNTKQKDLGINYDIQDEYGVGSPQSKNQKAITGEMIKEICIPIKVDRLGNIIELNNKRL